MATGAGIAEFLRILHCSPAAIGIEELTRLHDELPRARTIYRWHRTLGDGLIYYPSIASQSIGLAHVHLIIPSPHYDWQRWPYAVRARWMVRGPGQPVLYVHCLIPQEHVPAITAFVREHEPTARVILTGEGTQLVPALRSTPIVLGIARATDLVQRYPFVVAVACEHLERRASFQELWEAIYRHLGDRVWQCLPRRARRLPHNGKQYIREAFNLLNEHGAFRQYILRLDDLAPRAIDLLLILRADQTAVTALGAPVIEYYPATDRMLVLCSSTTETLRRIFTASLIADEHCFADHQRDPLHVRFAYELLLNPATGAWILPGDLSSFLSP